MVASVEHREIGRVAWGDGRTAVLRADGTWDVPDDARLGRMLTGDYLDDFRRMGPADGFPGVPQLHDWAARTGGTITLAPREPDPPGIVH